MIDLESLRLKIGPRRVGPNNPVFVIAEAGVNHDGDVGQAERLVDLAAAVGADAVKFQVFRAAALVSSEARKAAYQEEHDASSSNQREMLERLELPPAAFAHLAARARARGIEFLATPFDEECLEVVVRAGSPAVKIGSGDLTNHPLLAAAARTGLPVLLSTGMSDLDEVRAALAAIRSAGGRWIALLHCVSAYPAPTEEANLRAIPTLERAFPGVPVGYSDHTLGPVAALGAVALGATILEKHLTLDRSLPGPDHAASADPREFADLVRQVRLLEAALGDGAKRPRACEVEIRTLARRSLAAARRIERGSSIAACDLAILRPATGIGPDRMGDVLGRRAARDIPAGAILAWEMLE